MTRAGSGPAGGLDLTGGRVFDPGQGIDAQATVSIDRGLATVLTEAPKPRSKGIIVKDVAELLAALRQKGFVS